MKIKDVMNKDVITCKPDDSVGHLSDLFKEHHISGVPVVDDTSDRLKLRILKGLFKLLKPCQVS